MYNEDYEDMMRRTSTYMLVKIRMYDEDQCVIKFMRV